MTKLRLTLIALLLAACGDPGAGDLHNDAADGGELGSAQQAITAKKSSRYSIGYGDQNLKLCKNSGGPSLCIVPGNTTIRYKLDGVDACSNQFHSSWKYQVGRALTQSIPAGLNDGWGNPYTVVEDNNNPNVIFRPGGCAGSILSNDMSSFVCFGGASNPLTQLTESLPQWYYRHTGVLTVNIDVEKIRLRVGNCGSQYADDHHQLTEHAAHIAALLPYGGGMYDVHSCNGSSCWPSWDTLLVQPFAAGVGFSTYSTGGYTVGQLCRIGSAVQDGLTLTLNSGCTN